MIFASCRLEFFPLELEDLDETTFRHCYPLWCHPWKIHSSHPNRLIDLRATSGGLDRRNPDAGDISANRINNNNMRR
jgi:hypothetical protein